MPSTDGSADQDEEEAARGIQADRLCGYVHSQWDVGSAWAKVRWRDSAHPHVRAPAAGEVFQKAELPFVISTDVARTSRS